jgi:parallel beta-helix repeat protein
MPSAANRRTVGPLGSIATVALLIVLALAASAHAQQYATPGTGVDWTFDDLVADSDGVVTGADGVYALNSSVTISVGDRITVDPGTTVTADDDATIGFDVQGALEARGTPEQPIVFTGVAARPGAWRGFNYRDTGPASAFVLEHCEIAYAFDAVDAYAADVELRHCEIHHTLDKVIDITAADGLIASCHLHHNETRTITLSLSASPTIEDCLLEHNNLENTSPYPYINIGLQGVNSPTIRGNTILGSGNHMSGGIAIWNASNALIENNRIEGCGYGILCYQTGANPTITENLILDNTIHPDTVNWGFGVACNGDNAPIVTMNNITGHWYGVAAINGGRPNLGDLENDFPGDDGGNLFGDNGLGGEMYDFYNNTPYDQMAQGNWWGAWDEQWVQDSIWDQRDDPSLGLVDYAGFLEIAGAPAIAPAALGDVTAFPNPFNPQVRIAFTLERASHATVTIHDVRGRCLRELMVDDLTAGEHAVSWDGRDRDGRALSSGTYFCRVIAGGEASTRKLQLVR